MKRLFLMRHAKSGWDNPALDDFDRPLNERGREAARAMGAYMARAGHHPAVIFCSSARRTRETMDIILDQLAENPPVHLVDDLYLASARALFGAIHRADDRYRSILLIGHNPGMETLAMDLASPARGNGKDASAKRLAHKFPTGALAVFEANIQKWSAISEGQCALKAFIRPKHLDEDSRQTN
ncbi:MAG: histidine phosphatase family protein [Rhodospirillales bacterium]|nr:histidine phosphatase family protein [Rhodospirillales bacterium]MCW8862222.1 histidine phosphatase family protein [Rhodospirillales bacterium]MCW8951189.1 histidine phosphatase family protein [Rhodospirillales bacterium]MCW8971351.1 histidine phosphatase family protein [Rhodospirillales bacterium]MCW9001419.1 histidine phosphatase family protein [Rhodospirillales bacterium]